MKQKLAAEPAIEGIPNRSRIAPFNNRVEMYYIILMCDRFGEEQRLSLAGLPVETGGILEPWLRAYALHQTSSLSAV